MKSVPVWVWYSVLRIVLFVVPLTVLLVAGVNVWVSVLVAAVFGFSASLLFLRRARESMASDLYAARHREQPVVHDDDEAEDAAVDAVVDTSPSTAAGRSQSEDEPQPDAVDERGQAREL